MEEGIKESNWNTNNSPKRIFELYAIDSEKYVEEKAKLTL